MKTTRMCSARLSRLTITALFALLALAAASESRAQSQAELLDGLIGMTPVFRLQVALTTDHQRRSDGTDDDIWVSFRRGPRDREPVEDRYYLDSYRDDFENGTRVLYDVPPTKWGIRRIGNISHLEIGLNGTDGWCYNRLDVIVNSEIQIPITDRRHCMDNPSGGNLRATLVGDRDVYRNIRLPDYDDVATQVWEGHGIGYGGGTLVISRREIEKRIEGAIGWAVSRYEKLTLRTAGEVEVTRLRDGIYEVEFPVWRKSCEYFAGIPVQCSPWLEWVTVTYELDQRDGHRNQTFLRRLSWHSTSRYVGRRLFSGGGLSRIELFAMNHRSSEILFHNSALRIDF